MVRGPAGSGEHVAYRIRCVRIAVYYQGVHLPVPPYVPWPQPDSALTARLAAFGSFPPRAPAVRSTSPRSCGRLSSPGTRFRDYAHETSASLILIKARGRSHHERVSHFPGPIYGGSREISPRVMPGEGRPPSFSFAHARCSRGWPVGACPRARLWRDPWAGHDTGRGLLPARQNENCRRGTGRSGEPRGLDAPLQRPIKARD